MDDTIDYLDTTDPHAPNGLRERKRLETLCTIEDHATRLVIEHGYDAVTVEQICDAARISKRTFFNYVDSKETAVLGLPTVEIPDHIRERFLQSPPEELLESLVTIGCTVGLTVPGRNPEFSLILLRRHRQIMHAKPSLMAANVGTSIQRFHAFARLVEDYLEANPQARALSTRQTHLTPSAMSGRSLSEEATILTHLAQDAVHVGALRWMMLPHEAGTLENLLKYSLQSLGSIRTIASASRQRSNN